MPFPPRLVALCGNPTSGKTEAARILAEFGYELVDDGRPLRQIAIEYLGLTRDQVYTQEGKLEFVELNGRRIQVREILGELGNAFEEKFGGDIIPLMSSRLLDPAKRYVFGSVRRKQGLFWRKQGARVLEIVNPLAGPSAFEFDSFDRSAVHSVIINNGLARHLPVEEARADLRAKLVRALAL
ncbi:hypothetical protein [Ancylobacter rudongensis]|uniref:Dephospho-CoA kinase n=1 Tax=Ancylobacter rudongensis TaxID=177413 RepID=A0A1G4UPR9_9HYPH|nr:hypothetical protein [Ancylobacter rudongensis]SCW95567.1 hypothetical protein SAMN05660859_0057 [Ancylobacter rudongensis]